VAGAGGLDSRVRAAAAAAPGGGVEVLGAVSDEELWRQYARAAVVLMPSRYEGLGLVALEAMGAGCAVVGYDVSGLRDALAGGTGRRHRGSFLTGEGEGPGSGGTLRPSPHCVDAGHPRILRNAANAAVAPLPRRLAIHGRSAEPWVDWPPWPASSSSPTSLPPATSRRPSTPWRPGSRGGRASRPCWASPARARPSPAPTSSSACSAPPWCSRRTRRWRPSYGPSSASSSPATRWSTSSPTTTSTSPRPTSRVPTPISRRTRR